MEGSLEDIVRLSGESMVRRVAPVRVSRAQGQVTLLPCQEAAQRGDTGGYYGFIWSWTTACGMLSSTFITGLSVSIQPLWKVLTDTCIAVSPR